MKKFILLFLIITIIVLGVLSLNKENKEVKVVKDESINEIRSVFISYIDYQELKNKSEDAGKKILDEMIANIKNSNFNNIVLQVRAFEDAIYKSNYFPPSKTIVEDDNNLPFDILKYVIEIAHKNNISVYVWINPYRISNDKNYKISENSSYYDFINTNKIEVSDAGIYFNPAEEDVLNLILKGVEEILFNYDIEGLIYDDYFYPNKTIDLVSYEVYKKNGGTAEIDDFRINIINNLIRSTYEKVKSINKNVLFGISPSGNIENNLNEEYLDINYLLSNKGYLDFIMPQLYYGFNNSAKPFLETLNTWNEINKIKVDMIPVLALYKSGEKDTYANKGIDEWINNSNIIVKQIITARTIDTYKGFGIFRYDFLYKDSDNENLIQERDNIIELIKS